SVFGIIFLVLALLGIPNIPSILSHGKLLDILYIILLFISSMGLFMQKEWSRKLTLFFGTFWIIRGAFYTLKSVSKLNETGSSSSSLVASIASLMVFGVSMFLLWWYFTRPKVKEQFK
ncbi:MAG: hypothetical protein Q8N59_03765, partial [bacterium]|nr:hypothetical protein [bacterium]